MNELHELLQAKQHAEANNAPMRAEESCVWRRRRPYRPCGNDAKRPASQSGVVLIIALVFMAILTVIVLANFRTGALEERMTSNLRNRQLALQAAEAVARDAEITVVAATAAPFDPFVLGSFTDSCTSGFCSRPGDGANPKWKTINWTSTTVTRSFASANSGLSPDLVPELVPAQPRYIVELMSKPPRVNPSGGGCPYVVFRVTARGAGSDSAEVYVQTMYRTLPTYC